MDATVDWAIDDGVATITLDDGKVNALSPAMQVGISGALDAAEEAGAIVVLRGRAGNFSAGFDLTVLREGGQAAVQMVVGGFGLARRLPRVPAPRRDRLRRQHDGDGCVPAADGRPSRGHHATGRATRPMKSRSA